MTTNNNAKITLTENIADTNQTKIPVPDGKISLFADSFPYCVSYEKIENEKVIAREIMLCTGKDGNNLVVQRRFEACPYNDDATNSTKTEFTLEEGGIIEARVTRGWMEEKDILLEDLENDKAEKSDVYTKSETYSKTELQGKILNATTRIPSGNDLNNYKTPGFYYSPSNSDTENISNTPINKAFSLTVLQAAGVVQIFYGYGGNKNYIRTYYNGWNSWREIVVSGLTAQLGIGTSVSTSSNFSGKKCLVIGDSDTGFRQDGDGRLQCYANNQRIWHADNGQFYIDKVPKRSGTPSSNNHLVNKKYVDEKVEEVSAGSRPARIDAFLYG